MNEKSYVDGSYWQQAAPNYFLTDSSWKAHHLFSLIDRTYLNKYTKRRLNVCEVGCGVGGVLSGFVELIRKQGISCSGTGYDISYEAIEKARSLFPNISFEVTDIHNIQRKSDILLLVDVLEHVNNPLEFLSKCLDLSDLLVIHLPLDINYWGRLLIGKSYYKYLEEDRGHIHFFEKKTALELIHSVGADVIDWKYTKWGIEHDFDRSKSGRIARLLRTIGFHLNEDLSARYFGGASIALFCSRN